LPWLKPAAWKMVSQGNVAIRATAYRSRNDLNSLIGRIVSGQIVPSGIDIQFEAISSTGILYNSKDFDVKWQVVNTDHEAFEKRALRGGFYNSDTRAFAGKPPSTAAFTGSRLLSS
jgi:hypothetical protein